MTNIDPEREPISEFEKHAGDESWVDEGNEVYEDILEQMIEDFPSVMDDYAAELLYDGWFNPDISVSERAEIWDEFFEYTDIDWEDFDWDTWRDWYES